MSDWLPLREYLRRTLAEQIDHAVRHDPDPELRACLAVHRERVLETVTDKAELIELRRIVCECPEPKPVPLLASVNGQSQRVYKVAVRN